MHDLQRTRAGVLAPIVSLAGARREASSPEGMQTLLVIARELAVIESRDAGIESLRSPRAISNPQPRRRAGGNR